MTSSAEDWSFDNRFENYNPRCDVEEFSLSNNLYDGNDAQYGNSMANRFHEDEFDMSGSIFDVFDCGNEESAVSTIWIKVEPAASVDFDDGAGQACAFTAPDVYVDSSIPQECLDEGCGFSNNPFKTIARALEMINPTEDNPTTIHLAAGTYSPETGETYPIIMESNVNIEGEDEQTTILDAMQTGRVILMEYCDNNTISNLTIMGGLAEDNSGGGMSLVFSNPTLTHVTITDNTAANYGGGMFLFSSNPTLTNSIIWDNSPESFYLLLATPLITFSDIEGGWEGEGNIDADPLFTDPDGGDYSLQEGSPCIDAGTADIDGDGTDDITDYAGLAPDMGAFEFGESSEMAGDTNFDGIVDILDIVRIINQIMGNSEFNDDEFIAADFNADGIVDILDIVQIVNYILEN